MENRTLELMEKAFYDGAYGLVLDLSVDALKSVKVNNIAYLYRTLSEIGMADIATISPTNAKSSISFAFQQLCKENGTVSQYEKLFDDSLMMCIAITHTLEAKFKEADEELKQQYQGSAGISFDSDDPAEKVARERERAFNDNINKQRNTLKKKYTSIISSLFEIALTTIIQLETFDSQKHLIGLDFLDHLETVIHRASETTAESVKAFTKAVKAARNENYWAQNSDLYNALIAEQTQLRKKIKETLDTQLVKNEEVRKQAKEAKEMAARERKRYSLLNFKDRKPQNKIISNAKATIKNSKVIEKELKAGKCALCDADRKRLTEIATELSLQR